MNRSFAAAVGALFSFSSACGNGTSPPTTGMPDAPGSTPDGPPSPLEWKLGCEFVAGTADSFDDPSDFGPAATGSLAGWNPDGRWWFSEFGVGGSANVHFRRDGADRVIVDRDPDAIATLDETSLFRRELVFDGFEWRPTAMRISDRQPDGSLRAWRAYCQEDFGCQACGSLLHRATYVDPQQADKLALLGEYRGQSWEPGYTFNVRVAGTLAYVIRSDGLHIVETANPSQPVELGSWRKPIGGYSNDLKLVEANGKRYAIIADTPVDVVDVTNPMAPVFVTQIVEEAHTLFVESRGGATYAYFGNYNGTAAMYDVTNPAQPAKLGSYQAGFLVHDLSVANGIAYLNAWDAGLQAVDFTNPALPKLLGTFPSPTQSSHSSWPTIAGGKPIVLSGDEGYGAHLDIVDNDPASPAYMTSLAKYKTRDQVSIHNVMAVGETAYIAYYQDGVRVLDLANPSQPSLVGYFNTWDPQADYTTSAFYEGAVGIDVDPARKLVFVADTPRGLLILRDDT